jgi:hypothetical protein
LASIYKSKRPSNGQMDKSALGWLSGRAWLFVFY